MNESILFYTRNDYLVINNLLYNNHEWLMRGIEMANKDAKGVMQEAIEQGVDKRWGVSKEEGEKIFAMYKRRTPEVLDDTAIKEIIERAKADLKIILFAMKPAKTKIILYRNIRPENSLNEYKISNTIELKGLSSTSTSPSNESYGKEKTFIRYEITLPIGVPMLRASDFPHEMNEPDEVILPPMKCKIKGTRKGDTENCMKIIQLDFVELLVKYEEAKK